MLKGDVIMSNINTKALLIALVAAVIFFGLSFTGFAKTLLPGVEDYFAPGVNNTIEAWNTKAVKQSLPVVIQPTVGMTPEEIAAKRAAEEAAAAQAQAEAEAAAAAEAEAAAAAAAAEGA